MSAVIGIIGGTGREGRGLGYRWAKAGHRVIIGSRTHEKANAARETLLEMLAGEGSIEAMTNAEAVQACDVAVLTVPYEAHADTLAALKPALKGKLLIDVVVPLVPPKVTKVQMPPEGSALLQAKRILGEDTRVVDAFQTISFERLFSDEPIRSDVLVCGDGKEARETVMALVEETGLKAWDAGVAENSVVVEGLTSILIGLNIRYKVHSAGIQITGVE